MQRSVAICELKWDSNEIAISALEVYIPRRRKQTDAMKIRTCWCQTRHDERLKIKTFRGSVILETKDVVFLLYSWKMTETVSGNENILMVSSKGSDSKPVSGSTCTFVRNNEESRENGQLVTWAVLFPELLGSRPP